MKRLKTKSVKVLVAILLLPSVAPAKAEIVTVEVLERWTKELSNWGRWGPDDQAGTINLITPARRKAAAQLVTEGVPVSLAHNALTDKTPDNASPYEHSMTTMEFPGSEDWRFDTIKVSPHGFAHSHIDALCHRLKNGKLYNGYTATMLSDRGCAKLGINNLKDGIFTRGVLIDIPRLRGVPWLEPGETLYPKDLEAWEEHSGTKLSSGDVLLLRTGRWARRASQGPWPASEGGAGLHPSCAKWLRDREVAVIGSDLGSDVMPSGIEGEPYPMHLLLLVAMGMPILDNLDLEAVANKAASVKRWEFLFTASPLPIEGGTSSPLNPTAIF